MSANFLTTFDDTLPVLPGFSPAPSSTDNPALQLPGTPVSSSPSSISNSTPSSGTGNPVASGGSSGFTSFFGTRGIAIILGLIFIGGSILLFLGDDIAGAVKVAAKATA
jgi:hypothetical protein